MSDHSLPLPPARALPRAWRLSSDDRLAKRCAQGDRQAFAAIFERHHQAIFRYCLAILRDPEDAADALQNTMAAALRGLEGEQREIALRPWLFRIAHNESLSLMRRRRRHATLDDVDGLAGSGADVEVLRSERLRQLVEDLHALPERQRGALVMRELSGLAHSEIAAAFAVSEGAARQSVYEAREMLHELAEGRAMACADVRELISARDGRLLRGRKVRAHLRSCAGCREFRAAIGERRAGLAAVAPPLGAPAVASMLHGLLAGAGTGSAASTASGAATAAAGSATVAAKVAGAGVYTKAVAAVAAGATLAGGAVVAEKEIVRHDRPAAPAAAPVRPPAAPASSAVPDPPPAPGAPSAGDRRAQATKPAAPTRRGHGRPASGPGAPGPQHPSQVARGGAPPALGRSGAPPGRPAHAGPPAGRGPATAPGRSRRPAKGNERAHPVKPKRPMPRTPARPSPPRRRGAAPAERSRPAPPPHAARPKAQAGGTERVEITPDTPPPGAF